jgi:hypothetical protein
MHKTITLAATASALLCAICFSALGLEAKSQPHNWQTHASFVAKTDAITPAERPKQTDPSTVSAKNAAIDELSITALTLRLSVEEQQIIAKSVADAPDAQNSDTIKDIKIAEFLPLGFEVLDFPADVKTSVPPAARYKYLKVAGRLLIVEPNLKFVVAEIRL